MNAKISMIIILLTIFLLPRSSGASEKDTTDVTVKEIVQKVDELYRSESSYSEFEMKIITPHWERTLEMNAWTRGMEKTFIRIISPAKEKGVATLRIGNEMWNYLPKTNKVIKIPPSMMMSSWMGSDFTNDDLVREFTWLNDYHYEMIRPDTAKENLLYVKLIPKKDLPIVWGKIVVAVRKSDYIPVWEKYYDEKGKLMRILYFKDVKEFDDRKIPSVMELIPQTEEGHKTIIRYKEAEFNANVPDHVFTLRNLRKRK